MHGFVNSFGPCSVKMDVCVQDAPDIGNMVIHTEGPATACNLIFTADSEWNNLHSEKYARGPFLLSGTTGEFCDRLYQYHI